MIRSTAGRLQDRRREGVWPRVYRLRRGQRRFLLALAAVAILGGLALSAALLRDPKEPPALGLVPLVFVALGALLVAAVRTGRIVLYEDAIELVELGKGRRRLRREEIAGFRVVPMQYGQAQIVFERRGQDRKPVKAHWAHETDPVLAAWLADLTDLDAQERARAEAELLRSAALGADEPARLRALARARTVARVVNGLAVAACLWGWLLPRPYAAAVATLAVLPLASIALLLLGRGRYAFDETRNDPRPSLAIATAAPGAVLALRALLDVHVLDVAPLVAGAAAGGLALAGVLAAGDPKLRKPWLVLMVGAVLSFHPGGGLALANALLDREPAQVFEAEVLRKSISGGKQASHDLHLSPWGPVTEPASVGVDRALFRSVEPGARVCVWLRPGAVGARWYLVRACAPPGR